MQKRSFTLIELLVVLVIVGILLGIAIPAFEKLTMGSGVDAAARTLSSATSLARQFAISQRQMVAVLMPHGDSNIPPSVRYKAVAFCTVTASGADYVFSAAVPNTKIEFLPVGAVIAEVDTDSALSASPPTSSGTYPRVSNVDWAKFGLTDLDTGDDKCRAIVFRPSGAIAGETTYYIKVVEGEYTGSSLLVKNGQNIKKMEVNGFTGRGSFTP